MPRGTRYAALILSLAAPLAFAQEGLPLDAGFSCRANTCPQPGTSALAFDRPPEARDVHAEDFVTADGATYVLSLAQASASDAVVALGRLDPDGAVTAGYGPKYLAQATRVDDGVILPGTDDLLVLYTVSAVQKRVIRVDLPTGAIVPDFGYVAGADFAQVLSGTASGLGKLSFLGNGQIVVGLGKEAPDPTRFSLCFFVIGLDGRSVSQNCGGPDDAARQSDVIPDVVSVFNLSFGGPNFIAKLATPDVAKPTAWIFSPLSTSPGFAVNQPLFLNDSCDGVPARPTSIEAASASGNRGEFVVAGAQLSGLRFFEYAAIYERSATTGAITRIAAACDTQPGSNSFVALAPGLVESAGVRVPLVIGVSQRAPENELRLRGIGFGAGSVQFGALTEPLVFPANNGQPGTLAGRVTVRQDGARVLVGATRTWVGTDTDNVFARYLFGDAILSDSFESPAP